MLERNLLKMVFILFLKFTISEKCCVLESSKAATDIYMPVDAVVVKINEKLSNEPQLVNKYPYTSGIITLYISNYKRMAS